MSGRICATIIVSVRYGPSCPSPPMPKSKMLICPKFSPTSWALSPPPRMTSATFSQNVVFCPTKIFCEILAARRTKLVPKTTITKIIKTKTRFKIFFGLFLGLALSRFTAEPEEILGGVTGFVVCWFWLGLTESMFLMEVKV